MVMDRFSLPHPSGSGELLSDVSLTLAGGHRYGLIGRNGAGTVEFDQCIIYSIIV